MLLQNPRSGAIVPPPATPCVISTVPPKNRLEQETYSTPISLPTLDYMIHLDVNQKLTQEVCLMYSL